MPTTKPLVIVLLGPTASGKTKLGIEIAEQLNLNIHNIDSRQLYVGMDIGTAKPSQAQLERVPHHLINLREPDNPITLWEFQKEAELILQKNIANDGMALLVGGSGLYLKALTQGLQPPRVPPQQKLRQQLNQLGQEACYQLLQTADPSSGSRIFPGDSIRTQRALEVLYATGKSIQVQQSSQPPPWRVLEIGLDPKDLRQRIANRTSQLYSNGLIEETENLRQRFGENLPLLQTIGYKEALEVLNEKLDVVEAIKITLKRTYQFAKRQRTWFRKQHQPHWLKGEEPMREAMTLIKAGLG